MKIAQNSSTPRKTALAAAKRIEHLVEILEYDTFLCSAVTHAHDVIVASGILSQGRAPDADRIDIIQIMPRSQTVH